jgi:hypothetical protein
VFTHSYGTRSFLFPFVFDILACSDRLLQALKLAGQDPDFHRKDLWAAIEAGSYPKWKFGIQTIPEGKEDDFDFDPLDATKLWPEDDFPIRYIGELELNRNPDEYFTQTEQVAFCTGHVVPGIGFSDDPLLQGRNFSYSDTQLTRLGVNWQELPINKPVCPVMNQNRDGAMRKSTSLALLFAFYMMLTLFRFQAIVFARAPSTTGLTASKPPSQPPPKKVVTSTTHRRLQASRHVYAARSLASTTTKLNSSTTQCRSMRRCTS